MEGFMEEILVRCIIKFKFKRFYIAKGYDRNWYIVVKNSLSNYFKVGGDYSFYANVSKGVVFRKANPVEVSLSA